MLTKDEIGIFSCCHNGEPLVNLSDEVMYNGKWYKLPKECRYIQPAGKTLKCFNAKGRKMRNARRMAV